MSEIRRYLLTTPEQCLTLNTFIKNLPPGEKVRSVNPYPGGYEVIVLTEEKPKTEPETQITLTAKGALEEGCSVIFLNIEKPETEITVTPKNYNILRIRDYIDSGLGGSVYSN